MSYVVRFRRSLVPTLGGAVLTLGLALSTQAQCQLNGKIKHVVYVEFDNVHFTRDNPNVPSDLEQMPNLLNFIKHNGTLDAGDHTVLISHTANDILTTEIGLYSDNHGVFVANSFGVFEPGNQKIDMPSSFFYWTDLVSDITPSTKDNNFALVTPEGKNVPAPWVPFTRAGCDVAAFSTANIVLERTPFDVVKVFGAGSDQAMESSGDQFDHYVGAAIHCSINSPYCTQANHAVADVLPDEPGSYSGYQAVFGLKYIAPALGGLTDYNGNAITGFGNIGFDPIPAQTLAVVETMLKKGIPVVFAYIAESTFGPGEAAYVQQLADYNASFGTFFANLKAAGLDETNTLFIFTPDEGDHPVTGTASPAGCDGAKIEGNMVVPDVPCTYGPNGVGEIDLRLDLAAQAAGNNTPFTIHFDDAPTVYIPEAPGPNDPEVRGLEHTFADLTGLNPHTGQNESLLGTGLGPELQGALVDPVGQKMLHMNAPADPARTPTFTFFGNPNFFFNTSPFIENGVDSGFAWNHGDIQPEIGRTFIAIAGPGVRNLGITSPHDFFTDHVDLRPTLMLLTGLKDDYTSDGRAILELIASSALPNSLRAPSETLRELGQVYKQINAPFGQLAKSTLQVSTRAITSNSNGDQTYVKLENAIANWTAERDTLAAQIKSLLDAAEFNGQPIDQTQANGLIRAGEALLERAASCAEEPDDCGE